LRRLALAPLVVAVVLAANGWLYVVRGSGLPGPSIREALPLDELAKHASAPLASFVVVWIGAALLLAAAVRWARADRLAAALVTALATYALVYVATGVSLAITRQIPARDALAVAGRLGVVYLPAAIVGVVVAGFGRRERLGRRGPVMVAAIVAVAAALQLMHAVLPPGDEHGLLRIYTPEAVGRLANAAGACVVVALLFAARGLARRRHRAWQVAVALSAVAALVHLIRGFGPGALVSAIVLIVLVARREDFTLPGDAATRLLTVKRAALTVAAIAAYGFVALWLNRLTADQPYTLGFAARETLGDLVGLNLHGSPHLGGSFARWFPLSLLLMGLGATVWIVGGWLAPWRQRVQQEGLDRRRALELVRRFGDDTLAPFALRLDKAYFFDPAGESFLAYRVVGGVAIVSGDPIGSPHTFDELLGRFVEYAHERDWRIAILGASEQRLGLYRAHGLHALYHGDEAIVDTARFSLDGRPIRKVRQSVHRLATAGYTARVLRPGALDATLRRRLHEIAVDWRGDQPERGFAMALDSLFALGDDDAVFVVGFDDRGEARGFLHFAVAPAVSALSLSSMPRVRHGTPNGFNEWLICETIDWARVHGFALVSLNFSPFAALLAPEAELSGAQELQRQALLRLKGRFQLDNLLAFNRKFFPSWQRRFLVYERRLDLPRVSLAALAAEAYLPFQR
jgi:lysyl-tRNA synthetase, class II